MRNLTVALVVVIAVLGGFYGGWKYSQSKAGPSTPSAAVNLPGPNATAGTTVVQGGGGGFAGRGGTIGQVTAVNGNVLTIHNPQTGQDTKVQLGADTTVSKTAAGSAADLQPGVNVTVVGQAGSDGTVSAASISIVPSLPSFGGGGGRGRATPTPGT